MAGQCSDEFGGSSEHFVGGGLATQYLNRRSSGHWDVLAANLAGLEFYRHRVVWLSPQQTALVVSGGLGLGSVGVCAGCGWVDLGDVGRERHGLKAVGKPDWDCGSGDTGLFACLVADSAFYGKALGVGAEAGSGWRMSLDLGSLKKEFKSKKTSAVCKALNIFNCK